jgi:rRNA processing protein Krr1/Pno1
VAREALEMLFGGSPHGAVYKFLERKARSRGPEF